MPQEVRLWRVGPNTQLEEYARTTLDVEERLEDWLNRDIGIIDDGLLVIGRQVETEHGGFIDLLCVDESGDLVIVELKRDKTPREVTAQALDYASWVVDLGSDRIAEIAKEYLGSSSLEDAFRARFGRELPEALNENHRMLVVGTTIDGSSERIIRYLSEQYGVGINAVTFNFLRSPEGHETVARVHLLKPADVEYKARTRSGSKRRPKLTVEELAAAADQHGVRRLYDALVADLEARFTKDTTRSSLRFGARIDGGRRVVFSLLPFESEASRGLRFQLYVHRLAKVLGRNAQEIEAALPKDHESWRYIDTGGPDYEGFEGYFRDEADVARFVDSLRRAGSVNRS